MYYDYDYFYYRFRTIFLYSFFEQKLTEIIKSKKLIIDKIISGGAEGIDSLAERYAKVYNIKFNKNDYLPQWDIYGNSAGIIRNKKLMNDADLNIIFWNGISPGTKYNIDYCMKNRKKHYLILVVN